MSEHNNQKGIRLNGILDEIAILTTAAEADGADEKSISDAREQITALLVEGDTLRKSIEQDNLLLGLKTFVNEPAGVSKVYGAAGGDGPAAQPFRPKTLGELFVESEGYKKAFDGKTPGPISPGGANLSVEMKNYVSPSMQKATFNLAAGGLDSTVNYVNMGNPVLLEQQRLYVRDLLSQGQTTQNAVVFIKETSFTNSADMVAEEGEKPEASLALSTTSVPVKKIAVVLKVTEEMFADFPMMRDYVNTRLTFMVSAKEEQQLLNGTGAGNQITGILNSGPQTQAKAGDTNFVAVHKAITKVRVATGTTGGFEPDGIVIHPTDWQILRTTVDGNTQFYGGGPFGGQYGVGGYSFNQVPLWGLIPVITTAISAGTALVGAFKLGAQVWQREGLRLDSTNSNEDDFNFNRVSLRVEERLALAVYRASAFCTVTGIA
jgi:hypothetical protein